MSDHEQKGPRRVGRLRGSESLQATVASLSILLVRVTGNVATLAYTFLLTRLLDPSEVGLFWSIWSASLLAATLATLSVGSGSVREIVRARAQGDEATASGFLKVSRLTLTIASPIVMLGFAIWAAQEVGSFTMDAVLLIATAALAIPVLGWTQLSTGHANALKKTFQSQMAVEVARPVAILLLLSGFFLLRHAPTVGQTIASFFVAASLAAMLQLVLLRPALAAVARNRPNIALWRHWVSSGLFMFPGRMVSEYFRSIVILLCAATLAPAEVGLIAVAFSIINLLSFSITAIDLSFGPRLANALVKEDAGRAERLLAISTALKFVPVMTATLVLFVFLDTILGLFGRYYGANADAVRWLLLIPVSRALLGDTTMIMQLRGHRMEVFWTNLLALAVLAVAVPIAGRLAGVEGAAAASALVIVILQSGRYLSCRVATRIDTSILGAVRTGWSLRSRGRGV